MLDELVNGGCKSGHDGIDSIVDVHFVDEMFSCLSMETIVYVGECSSQEL